MKEKKNKTELFGYLYTPGGEIAQHIRPKTAKQGSLEVGTSRSGLFFIRCYSQTHMIKGRMNGEMF